MSTLAGRTAIVTCDGTGIGAALALSLSILDCNVLVVSDSHRPAYETCERIKEVTRGRPVQFGLLTLDAGKPGGMRRAVGAAMRRFKTGVDFVVMDHGHKAGIRLRCAGDAGRLALCETKAVMEVGELFDVCRDLGLAVDMVLVARSHRWSCLESLVERYTSSSVQGSCVSLWRVPPASKNETLLEDGDIAEAITAHLARGGSQGRTIRWTQGEQEIVAAL